MSGAGSWIGQDLPPVMRDGQEYFLISHQDALYLIANQCPHRGGPLKFGFINDRDEIVCPLHQGAFPIAKLIAQSSTIQLTERRAVLP